MTSLPIYPHAQPLCTREGRFGQLTRLYESSEVTFRQYLLALEADGWEIYDTNQAADNLFATYTKGSESLHCCYIAPKGRCYIIQAPHQHLQVRRNDEPWTPVCKPLLTQEKMRDEIYHGGMSYTLRLSDGRFIIIDGGYNELDFFHARQLYELLQGQNVLPKITVAAWIITHPHGDHLGTASDFLQLYGEDVVDIQRMLYNFPMDEEIAAAEPLALDGENSSYMPAFLRSMASCRPDLPVTVTHTGQRYYFADAVLEFLHAPEDLYPLTLSDLTSNWLNGASTVFSLEIAGQKFMFLADSALHSSEDLALMWGDYLKSDIMQAAHHAQRGGTPELYSCIDPQVVLVPMYAGRLGEKTLKYEGTQWLWNNGSGNIRQIIVSGFGRTVMELPYSFPPDTPLFPNAISDPWGGLQEQYQWK